MTKFVLKEALGLLEITFADGEIADFPLIWLRDNCATAFHPETKERVFELLSVPEDLMPVSCSIEQDELLVDWGSYGPVSRYSVDWLQLHAPGKRMADPADIDPLVWRSDISRDQLPSVSLAAVQEDEQALLDWLRAVKASGVGFVTGLTDSDQAGIEFAKRIGFLRETNFGVTFDVISKPNPNNLAYTAVALPLHIDLTNQEMPPGFQFLHCLQNDAEGGGSLLCDGFAIAQDLKQEDTVAYDLLASCDIPMRFHDETTDIRRRDVVIGEDRSGRLRDIRFNAHLAGMFDMPADVMGPYYRAYRKYMTMSRSDSYVVSFRLAAGEMMVFDNRRVLHGRDAFDPQTGLRSLRGCYVDRGEWDSRIRVMTSDKS